jgi:glycosyltransferase 2 family protein
MSEPSRPAWHALRDLLLLLLLGLGIYLILPQITTLQHSVQVIRGMVWWAVALAIGAQVLSYLGSGVLLQAIALTEGDRISVIRATVITTASYSVGFVAGGMVGSGAATYRWMRASGTCAESALLAGWLPAVIYDGALLVVAIFGLLYLLIVHQLTALQALSFGLILLILGVLAATITWGTHHRPQLTSLATHLAGRWAALLHRPYTPATTQASVGRVFRAWDRLGNGGWHGPAFGAAINTVFDMLTLYFVFVAAGHLVSLAVLLAGYGLPLLLGRAPLLPGGVGIVETSMAAIYTGLGVPAEIVVVVVLTYRFISFWLPTFAGFALIPCLRNVTGSVEKGPAQEGDRL